MTVELLSALVLCASLVVTLVASLQQARRERRRADALDERWAAHLGETIPDPDPHAPLVRHEERVLHSVPSARRPSTPRLQ
jgi:hypothetical protein